LRSALALGVRFIHLDVHLSGDGIPVVCNEQSLARAGGTADMSAATLATLDVGRPDLFGERFRETRIPLLAAILELLEGHPEITLFAELGRAAVARFGHDKLIVEVARTLHPFRSRCVLVSKDLATIHTARTRVSYPVGWMLAAYDAHARLKFEAFQPEYLFCSRSALPAAGSLWRGPWRWAIADMGELQTALDLASRGADFVVTAQVRRLGEAMRARAAAAGR